MTDEFENTTATTEELPMKASKVSGMPENNPNGIKPPPKAKRSASEGAQPKYPGMSGAEIAQAIHSEMKAAGGGEAPQTEETAVALPDVELSIEVATGFVFSQTGISVTGKPTFEVWQEGLARLAKIEGASQKAIGDMLNYGAGRVDWGEKYAQAVDSAQAKTWTNYASVASKYKPGEWVPELSYTHHAEVAYLPKPDRKKLLKRAVAEGMTVSKLRAAKNALQNGGDEKATASGESQDSDMDADYGDEDGFFDEADDLKILLDNVDTTVRAARKNSKEGMYILTVEIPMDEIEVETWEAIHGLIDKTMRVSAAADVEENEEADDVIDVEAQEVEDGEEETNEYEGTD